MSEVSTSRRAVMRALAIIPSIIATPSVASSFGIICTPTAFPAALAAYRHAREDFERIAELGDDDAANIASNIADDAFEAMLKAPARSAADIAIKLDVLLVEYLDCVMDEERVRLIADDARRMAGEARA